MALTRKMLKAMGIEDEKIEQIIDAHTESYDAIKAERDANAKAAEELEDVKKRLKEAIAENETNNAESWKVKYDALKEDFETYKNDISAKELKTAKETAYKKLLKDVGISEKRIDAVLRVSKLDDISIEADGKIKDASKLKDAIKNEWSDFIVTTETKGADTATPPAESTPKTFSREDIEKMSTKEINANWDAVKQALKN